MQSRDEMTARLIAACENPYVTIIGHPTGRLGASTALRSPGTSLITTPFLQPPRAPGPRWRSTGKRRVSTFPAPLARKAKTFGVTFALDSDAHRTGDLSAIEFAVGQARRAGLTKSDVLNAQPLEYVRDFVARKRPAP